MDLTNYISNEELAKKKDKIKKIFFYRICGTGMGACACLLREAGFEVHGADQNFYPPMSDYLKTTGIKTYSLDEVNKDLLSEYDLIVVGNSVPRVSEHSKLIESCGVMFTSFPSVMGSLILKDRSVIGVAGTHGKTTTTNFIKDILNKLGEDTGYFIGGILNGAPPAKIGKSKYFVIESDEYDSAYFQKISKFRLYEMNKMILTSLEFDHADIFDSISDIEDEFKTVIPKLDYVVANSSYESIRRLYDANDKIKWNFYGAEGTQGPFDILLSSTRSHFKIKHNDSELSFETNIIGEHNILNISSCLILLLNEGFSYQELKLAVANLSLVKRRQELRGSYKKSLVVDDFAHHPRAIDLTIRAIQTQYPDKEIITIFEPVSATARSNHFQKEFADSFASSKSVIIAKSPMSTTAKGKDNLDCEKLRSDLVKKGTECIVHDDLSKLRSSIDELASDKSLFLILSNRSCIGLWESDFVQSLT